ncbi:MAG TPA: hypothetical protein VML75_08340 [Kofleriaceae bacterium]|nr:hypothetical protein [Kofleriaceae bacterium]
MALERLPVDPASLTEAARKVVAPGPMKMMAARGLAPLSDPADLVTVLYQLSLDPDAQIAESARAQVEQLPDRILEGALGQPVLDRLVLDFFADKVRNKAALLELIILNSATADETLAELAAVVGAREVDLIATNEQRLLRHPAIIGALYSNLKARMSTVDRAVELAIRNGIKVPGIAAWEELSAAITGAKRKEAAAEVKGGEIREVTDLELEDKDALFEKAAQAAARDEDAEPTEDVEVPISQMSIPMKIRLAMLGNKFQRSILIRDANKMVALAAVKAPGVTEMDAARLAGNTSLSDDVITYIANRRDWTKLYGVKLSLVGNPKTPIPAAIRFLDHLREKDLRNIARSKGVPSAISAGAKKRLIQKGGKK